jgi:hypothetical protein
MVGVSYHKLNKYFAEGYNQRNQLHEVQSFLKINTEQNLQFVTIDNFHKMNHCDTKQAGDNTLNLYSGSSRF